MKIKIKTFRQQYFNVDRNIEVFVPILQGYKYNLGFPDLIEIFEFDCKTLQFQLNNKENYDERLFSTQKLLYEVSMKEIFYYSLHEWQITFVKAIKV